MERAVANCRTALFVVLGVQVGLCAWVLSTRLGFPSDIEWMTGTVLDGIERARAGKPTYAAPNEGWIPFLYPPLYTWLGALLGGSALACRLLSVASVLVQTAMAAKMTKDLGAPRAGSAIAALLVIACFSYVGFFYDLERSDTLFGAFVMTGAALLVAPRRSWSAAAAGAIFGLGLLTKQQAIFFLGGAFVGLLLADRRRWRDPLVLAIAFAVVTAPIFIFENARTNGWFFYYVIALPRSHGLMKSLAAGFLRDDVLDGFSERDAQRFIREFRLARARQR